MFVEKRRNTILDVYKVICTIIIFFHHYQQAFGANTIIHFSGGKIKFGWIVEFFFMISGFLMYEYSRNEKLHFNFLYKRYIRLFPMLLFAGGVDQIIALISYKLGVNNGVVSRRGLLYEVLGVQTGYGLYDYKINDPSWYIDVLLFCYLLFFLYKKLSELYKIKQEYIWGISIIAAWFIYWKWFNYPLLNWIMARGISTFFMGLLLAKFLSCQESKIIEENTVLIKVICLCSILFMLMNNFSEDYQNYIMIVGIFIPLLCLSILFNEKNGLSMMNKIISNTAEISFVVYMIHSTVIKLLRLINYRYNVTIINKSIGMFIALFFTYLLSFIISRIYDKPIRNILIRICRRNK